jgi:hypothetical protein
MHENRFKLKKALPADMPCAKVNRYSRKKQLAEQQPQH